ncbi:MAG: hypothetical protein MJZ19_05270 [Paludibacteraceae bacterium]|nr:hypothetical protein [Paludibacteraceae bacterium]
MKVFVKASDLVDNQGLQGVLECEVSEYNFSIGEARVVLPNGSVCKDTLDADSLFVSKECEHNASVENYLVFEDKAEQRLRKGNQYFFVKDFELFSGLMTFETWNIENNECVVSICGQSVKPSEFFFYNSKDEALKMEQIKTTFQDGTEELQGGWARQFFLDERQKELIHELEELISECNRAGIEFAYDTCNYDGIYAYRTNVKGYKVSMSEFTENFLPEAVLQRVKARIGDYNCDCPYCPSAEKID